ncbi:MAG: hypothetical protein A4S09_02165 [Proteobacteria bacterium SG_bin7]|nr:MAG: hypothetical protein A4S09_02165 [Proteobacteria bacterium SG_bin7]
MGVEQVVVRGAAEAAGFSRSQTIFLSLMFGFFWGIGGYVFSKVEILGRVQYKVVRETVHKKTLKEIRKDRISADKAIIKKAFWVANSLDQQIVAFKKNVYKNKRLPAGTTAEPLEQLLDKEIEGNPIFK